MPNTAPSNVVHAFPPAPSLHEGLLDGVRTLINEGDLLRIDTRPGEYMTRIQ